MTMKRRWKPGLMRSSWTGREYAAGREVVGDLREAAELIGNYI